MKNNYLALSWSTSRGRDTYGYNICRLDDRATDVRHKCMGGGYDLIGTVVGRFLAMNYQSRLVAIADQFASRYTKADGFKSSNDSGKLYGGCYHADTDHVSLDGACGLSSMIAIAAAIGVQITQNYNRKGQRTEGFFVSEYASAADMKAANEGGN